MINTHFIKFFFGFIGLILLGLFGLFLVNHLGLEDEDDQTVTPLLN